MSFRSGGTTCSSTGRIGSVGWYRWGGEKYARDLRFWIARNNWRVSWYFRYLYISAISWNMTQVSLVSLCKACVLLRLYTFTNPVRLIIIWYSWSSSVLFIWLITAWKYLMADFGRILSSPKRELIDLTTFCNCSATPCHSKGKLWPP